MLVVVLMSLVEVVEEVLLQEVAVVEVEDFVEDFVVLGVVEVLLQDVVVFSVFDVALQCMPEASRSTHTKSNEEHMMKEKTTFDLITNYLLEDRAGHISSSVMCSTAVKTL